MSPGSPDRHIRARWLLRAHADEFGEDEIAGLGELADTERLMALAGRTIPR